MSQKDRERLKVLHAVRQRHITQEQAGKELGITARWVRELLGRMKVRGDRAVVHGLRGKRSNRRLPEAVKARAVKLFAQKQQARQWHDYGPTLAAEELAEEHGLKVGKETLRKWLREAGLWKARRARWSGSTNGADGGHAGGSCCNGTLAHTTGWRAAVRGYI